MAHPSCCGCGRRLPLSATWLCSVCGQQAHRECGHTLDLGPGNRPYVCDGCSGFGRAALLRHNRSSARQAREG